MWVVTFERRADRVQASDDLPGAEQFALAAFVLAGHVRQLQQALDGRLDAGSSVTQVVLDHLGMFGSEAVEVGQAEPLAVERDGAPEFGEPVLPAFQGRVERDGQVPGLDFDQVVRGDRG
jgi:hypothetical protein